MTESIGYDFPEMYLYLPPALIIYQTIKINAEVLNPT
jgi:hypothetical protein